MGDESPTMPNKDLFGEDQGFQDYPNRKLPPSDPADGMKGEKYWKGFAIDSSFVDLSSRVIPYGSNRKPHFVPRSSSRNMNSAG